jgi:hypothetical protein
MQQNAGARSPGVRAATRSPCLKAEPSSAAATTPARSPPSILGRLKGTWPALPDASTGFMLELHTFTSTWMQQVLLDQR